MRKWLLTTLALLLVLGFTAACGSPANPADQTAAQGTGQQGAAQQGTAEQDTGQAAGRSIDKIKERGKLIVGVFTDKPPFGMTDEKGNYIGFDTDLAKRFAKDLLGDESKIEFVPVEPASRIPFLQSDKVDIIVANMTITDDRKEAVDFTNPTMKVATQILVKEDSGVQTIDDLKGKDVIVTKGTTADIYLTENYPEINLIKFDKNSEALQALKDGRGIAYAQDNFILIAWAKKNPGYVLLPEKLEEGLIAPAVKKGNTELRDWVNEELKKLAQEKFLLQLYDKYVKDELGEV
mgnify:CR=1 FL=1